ncbi:hypothetical protein MMC07_000730 [Pseudocyphellaria aurata]|nr:hypothetical protein [Pseudocyphellaria aurata]
MASRGKYGARLLGHPERDDMGERPTLKPSPRPSTTSSVSSASRIPSYTSSFFSRNKPIRTDIDPLKGRTDTSSKRTVETTARPMKVPSSRAELPAKALPQSLRNLSMNDVATNPSSSPNPPNSEKRQRNVLRRKASSVDQHAQYARTESSMSSHEPTPQSQQFETASSPGNLRDPFAGSILGLAMPAVSSSSASHLPGMGAAASHQATSSSRMANYNIRSTPHTISTQNLPPPTPSFAHSSGSSTRRSESPGAFSRTSTPTSMSSHSPGIPLPAKSPIRVLQVSPTRSRPPVTRRKIGNLPPQDDMLLSQYQGLSALRESGTSSSSSSTVKGAERVEGSQVHITPRRLSPPPPSPPLRQTSKRFLQPRDELSRSRHPFSTPEMLQRRPERAFRTRITEESEPTPKVFTQPARSRGPPPRPSREGTPKLDDNAGPSPIIQSNLSRLITTGHKRRESLDKTLSSPEARQQAASIPRSTVGYSPSSASTLSIKPSRLPSPNPGSVSSPRPRPADVLKTRDIPVTEANANIDRPKDSSPLSAASNKSSSRFGLFTKRTKSPLETSRIESGEKPAAKKGPTAGTGHEGYGKYAKRGRSGSVSTSASRGRSTSTGGTSNSLARTPTSRKSSITSRGEAEMDDFLLERLAPVVISGGGAFAEIRDGGTESYRKISEDESVGRLSKEGLAARRPLAYAQADVSKATSGPAFKESNIDRRGSRVLADGREHSPPVVATQITHTADQTRRPTLAARRSLHRSQLFKEAGPIKIPAPINTQVVAPSPSVNSYDTMQSSVLRTDSTQVLTDDIFEGREGNWLKPRKPEKRARSPRKWNFFQRTHATPKTMGRKPLGGDEGISEVPVTISRIPDSRPVAHYAMLDGNDQESSSSTVNLLSDANDPMQSQYMSRGPITREFEPDAHKENHKYSMLLPSPPKFSSDFAAARRSPSPTAIVPQPDPMPLTAVPRDTTPKPKGSRLQQVGRIPRVVSKRDRPHNPPPQSFSRPFVRPPAPLPEASSFTIQPLIPETVPQPTLGVNTEFPPPIWENDGSPESASAPVDVNASLSPPSREEFLAFPPRKGSEVSGSSSSGTFNFAATTAVVPQPGVTAGEDEVWNEYDELLDIVESPAPLVKGTSILDENRSKKVRPALAALQIRKESSITQFSAGPSVTLSGSFETSLPTAALPTPPHKLNLLSPLHSAELVSTPLSFSDFFAGYGDRNRASAASKRHSISTGSRYSQKSAISESSSQYSRDNEGKKRNTEIMAEKTEPAPGAESNLRFSALMTSRWLSFGRVLFSPAHLEIHSNRHDRVLVLDGLGNDDWSFYCALTYPHATVYNLSPFPDSSDRRQEPGAYDSPSNHRQIYHTSIAHPFPFPKGFFTAAVFRFPVASSESACYNAISECKRVLRPGGYLEMSILDLDMVNMGNRARRAVRMLKVRMQVADPDVSLKPASDNIQKMLGRRGFENLNRCMVHVPIAGHISDSRAGSFEEKNMSLGDMLKDSSQQGDEGISKMVAKVGRWWYTRCYEMGVLPHDDMERSIWADRALLRECEKRETGLKLLICFAQKPSTPKRRTVSM